MKYPFLIFLYLLVSNTFSQDSKMDTITQKVGFIRIDINNTFHPPYKRDRVLELIKNRLEDRGFINTIKIIAILENGKCIEAHLSNGSIVQDRSGWHTITPIKITDKLVTIELVDATFKYFIRDENACNVYDSHNFSDKYAVWKTIALIKNHYTLNINGNVSINYRKSFWKGELFEIYYNLSCDNKCYYDEDIYFDYLNKHNKMMDSKSF